METLLINNIYHAIEGEGARIGHPQVFIRLQGCTIGCINCDSKETWEFSGTPKPIESIISDIKKITNNQQGYWVSITGGDPLHIKHEKGLLALCERLKAQGYFVNIEASGTRVVDSLFSQVDFISCDFKTPSTGVKTSYQVLKKVIENYPHKYQIKSVISHREDFMASVEMYERLLKEGLKAHWFLTPCFETGELIPQKLIQDIYSWVRDYPSYFRVVSQQHKFIYGSTRRDV